ncbi:MAG: hypothetical protein WDW36_006001 [Sanguina aurantia]
MWRLGLRTLLLRAAAKDPVAGEGRRAPLRLTLRIPSSQLPAALAVLRYPYRPNSLVLEPHTDPLLVLNTALVAHTLGVTRLRDMCTSWLGQAPMTWGLSHTLLALDARAKHPLASTNRAAASPLSGPRPPPGTAAQGVASSAGLDAAPAGGEGAYSVPLRQAGDSASSGAGADALLRWVRGPAAPTAPGPQLPRPLSAGQAGAAEAAAAAAAATAAATATTPGTPSSTKGSTSASGAGGGGGGGGEHPADGGAGLGSVVDVATSSGLLEDLQLRGLVERAQDFALLGFRDLELAWGQTQARAMLEQLPYEVLLCLITQDQLQVATENTVALAVISWIQAGYQRILPSVKSDAAAWAASLHQHEQHSLVLLSEVRTPVCLTPPEQLPVRYPYLTSSYLVHILPVLTEGLGSALQAALAQHTQEAYTFNSSSPEKKCALAGEVHHSRFLPRLMYLQPPHDQLRLHLSMDLQRLSKTWLPAVSAVSPYLRALLLSTPACHTSSEDKYYNGFYWRLSVAADEFVGLSWCVLLRGNEVPLPGDTPKVMVCASVCAPGGPGTTTHPRPSGSEPATRTPKPHPPHTHVLRHEVPVSTVVPQHPYSAGAASPDAVRTPGAPPSPAPAVSASIAPAGAEDADLVTPGSTSTAASPLARPAGGASTQTGALGPGSVQPGALSHPPHVHPLAKTPSGPGESLRVGSQRGRVRELHGLVPPRSMGGFGPHADAVGHGMEVGGGGGSQGWMGLLAKLGDSLGVNMRSGEHSGASVTLQCTLHSCD